MLKRAVFSSTINDIPGCTSDTVDTSDMITATAKLLPLLLLF